MCVPFKECHVFHYFSVLLPFFLIACLCSFLPLISTCTFSFLIFFCLFLILSQLFFCSRHYKWRRRRRKESLSRSGWPSVSLSSSCVAERKEKIFHSLGLPFNTHKVLQSQSHTNADSHIGLNKSADAQLNTRRHTTSCSIAIFICVG